LALTLATTLAFHPPLPTALAATHAASATIVATTTHTATAHATAPTSRATRFGDASDQQGCCGGHKGNHF
jgi:hypothetical protein